MRIDSGGGRPASTALGLSLLLAACSSEPRPDELLRQQSALPIEELFEARPLGLGELAPDIPDLDALGPDWDSGTPIEDDRAVPQWLAPPRVPVDELFRDPGLAFGMSSALDELHREAAALIEDPSDRRNGS